MSKFRYIEDMRRRLGKHHDDATVDLSIEAMSPAERLGLIAGWNLGYPGWERTILNWVRDAGFEVSEKRS